MIKLTSKLLENRGIVAFSLEASSPEDVKTLDLFSEAVQGVYKMEAGFASTNRLIVHVRGMDEYFPDPALSPNMESKL
jgi:hypothetical protein